MGKKLFISHILRNPFLVGVFLIRVKCGAQDISLYTCACRSSHVEPISFIPSASPSINAFWSSLFHTLTTFRCARQSRDGLSVFWSRLQACKQSRQLLQVRQLYFKNFYLSPDIHSKKNKKQKNKNKPTNKP